MRYVKETGAGKVRGSGFKSVIRKRIKSHPLRISAGWTVTYNNGFYELDPSPENLAEFWWRFKKNMLQMKHHESDLMIDVYWTPEGNFPDGSYKIKFSIPIPV